MAENKSISLVILGIVAICAVVGLVLLFSGAMSGKGIYVFGEGGKGTYSRYVKPSGDVQTYTGPRIGGITHDESYYASSPATANQRVQPYSTASQGTNPCTPGFKARGANYVDYYVTDMYGKEWGCTYAASLAVE